MLWARRQAFRPGAPRLNAACLWGSGDPAAGLSQPLQGQHSLRCRARKAGCCRPVRADPRPARCPCRPGKACCCRNAGNSRASPDRCPGSAGTADRHTPCARRPCRCNRDKAACAGRSNMRRRKFCRCRHICCTLASAHSGIGKRRRDTAAACGRGQQGTDRAQYPYTPIMPSITDC